MRWDNTLVLGIGVNDLKYKVKSTPELKKANKVWMTMLRRCYSKKYQLTHPSYIGCYVSKDWLIFSNFYKWFKDNYKNNYVLDKDLLVKNNKEYSKDKCCFIPMRINELIVQNKSQRGNLPIGIHLVGSKYRAQLHKQELSKQVNLGLYNTIDEAFNAYKLAKEQYIKEIANQFYHNGKIEYFIYKSLISYKITKND